MTMLEMLIDWLHARPTVYDLLLWFRDMTPAEIAGTLGVLIGTVIRDVLGRITALVVLAWWRGDRL